MKLPKELTTVTPLSKILAAILFIMLPFIGFFLGTRYQRILFAPMEMAPVREHCDINQDGKCDIADFDKFKESLGKKRGDLGYNPLADTNIDGIVNGDDAIFPFPITLPADAYPTLTPFAIPTVDPSITANWKTYRNEKYEFSVEYPPGWHVVDHNNKYNPPDSNRLVFLLFGKGTPPDYALTHPWRDLSIDVYKTPFSEKTINRNEITQYSQLNNDNSLTEVDAMKFIPTQFMGLKANKKIQLAPDIIDGNLGINIYFNANGYGWDIHYPALDYQGNNDPIYDQILSTFKFTP